jgi:hypothetical protein
LFGKVGGEGLLLGLGLVELLLEEADPLLEPGDAACQPLVLAPLALKPALALGLLRADVLPLLLPLALVALDLLLHPLHLLGHPLLLQSLLPQPLFLCRVVSCVVRVACVSCVSCVCRACGEPNSRKAV